MPANNKQVGFIPLKEEKMSIDGYSKYNKY